MQGTPLLQLLIPVNSNIMAATVQMKATMEGLTLSISALNSVTVKLEKLRRPSLSIRDVTAGGRLFLYVIYLFYSSRLTTYIIDRYKLYWIQCSARWLYQRRPQCPKVYHRAIWISA